MGAVQNIVDRVRRFVAMDKERGGELLAKGSTSPTYPDSGYDLLQAYGYDALSDYLRLEHDLLSRFVDYEEMDDYPEIACISGDLRLLVATLPREMVSSGKEDTMGFTSVQALTVRELYEEYEAGRSDRLYVFALDHKQGRVRVVKAIGPRQTGEKVQVYKVTYESYRKSDQWSVTCTGDHLFMLRDGSYKAAMDLEPGERLMPCTLRTGSIGYSVVYEPLRKTPAASPVYTNVHGLVAEAMCGRPLTDLEIVHHKDRDKTNFRPLNLEVTSIRAHVREHVRNEKDEERRIALVSEGLRKKWADPSFKKQVSESHCFRDPAWLEAEQTGKHKHYEARGELSDAHRAAIAKGRTIPLAQDVVDATLRASASINEAASRLGVSWNTLVRRMDQYGLDRSILGSNLGGPQPGDEEYLNHRVVSVERAGFEDVYDLEVPEYHNFAVGTDNGGFVFVHNSAVDVYADDASQPDTQLQRSVWVSSPDKTLQGVLDDLFYKRLRLDEEIWEITRSLVKYGNNYEEMLVTSDGVVGLNFLPAPTVRRVEGPRGELYGFVQDFKGRFGYSPQEFQKILAQRTEAIRMAMQPGGVPPAGDLFQRVSALEPWEVAHFRLRGKHRRSVYGYSVLEPARWIWKRLMLLEDAAMIYRLQRAPERYAFYVDVGDLPPGEALAFVNKVRQQHKKKRFVNPSTGKLDLKFEPIAQDDDFWVPVRKGVEGTRIEVLGGPSWQHMDDVQYFQTKMFSALKVPKAYLAQDDNTARAVLSSEDVRFARSVLRVQREVRNGLGKIARTHLAALNIDPYSVEYSIHMTVPSAIFELAQLEVRNARADLAARMREHVSLRWVLENVYQLSNEDIRIIIQERSEDTIREGKAQAEVEKLSALAQAAAQGATTPPEAGGESANPRDALSGLRLLERRLAALPSKLRGPISEKELLRGDRSAEKRAEGKLDRILRENSQQSKRLREVGALLRDVVAAANGR